MIPFATTTISVLRLPPDAARDVYDVEPDRDVIAAGVRAHISPWRGQELIVGGSQETIQFRMDCDPTDIDHDDQVLDEKSTTVYEVIWVSARIGLGLDHVVGHLKLVEGVV